MGSEEGVVHHGEMQSAKHDSMCLNILEYNVTCTCVHRPATNASGRRCTAWRDDRKWSFQGIPPGNGEPRLFPYPHFVLRCRDQ